MATTYTSHNRTLLPSLNRLLKNSSSSSIRYFSTQRTEESNGDADGEESAKMHVKPNKPCRKTQKAKSMARLINIKPWSSDLESTLGTLSPSLSKTTTIQTLHLINNPSKALRFFEWTWKMGFPHDQQSYFCMLEILGHDRNLNAARNFLNSIETRSNGVVKLESRFFNSLIRSYGRAGLFQEAYKVFETMKTMGVSPSVISFNSLLFILLQRGRTNMANSLFDEMLKTYGVTPDLYTFNILIRGFCKNSMVDKGFFYFKEMEKFKCEADVITYNTLVDGLCRSGKVKVARNVVRGMIKKSVDLSPNVVTYTTLIGGYCMKQEIDEALAVFHEMVDRGIKPNQITYNTLIKGLCKTQETDRLREILAGNFGGKEFVPDTCTFNILMSAQCNDGKLNDALKVFEKMSKLHVQPDSASYSVLIRSLCEKKDFEKAEELFDELSKKELLLKDEGCRPLVAAYNPMFEHLCQNGKTKKAEKVFRQLMKRGTQDPPSYMILITGHCKEGTFEAAYELLVLMLRRDYKPDFETYQSIIDGLLQKGEPVLAYDTLVSMLRSCHIPKTSTFHSILSELLKKGCASESASFIMFMLEKHIVQNFALSTRAIKFLFISGKRDKAYRILGLLYESGFTVKMAELINCLCQKKESLLDAHKTLMFCLEKHQQIDVNLCSKVIEGLCKRKNLSEAFTLCYELLDKGVYKQLSCLEDLRIALEAGGKLEEANFILKRMQSNWQPDNPRQCNSSMCGQHAQRRETQEGYIR